MYIYIYKLCKSMFNVQIYISKIRHSLSGVIFRFLPNLRRLNKIMKSVKSTNLNKTAIKSNAKIFPIYN